MSRCRDPARRDGRLPHRGTKFRIGDDPGGFLPLTYRRRATYAHLLRANVHNEGRALLLRASLSIVGLERSLAKRLQH